MHPVAAILAAHASIGYSIFNVQSGPGIQTMIAALGPPNDRAADREAIVRMAATKLDFKDSFSHASPHGFKIEGPTPHLLRPRETKGAPA